MKFYHFDKENRFRKIQIKDGAFVVIKSNKGETIGGHFSRDELNQFIKWIEEGLEGSAVDCEWKAVGFTSAIQGLKKFIDSKKSLQVKLKTRDEEFKVLYDTHSGKLKLSKPLLSNKVKVLIVEDSTTIRNLLKKIFLEDSSIEVIGELGSAEEVSLFLQKSKPDVMTLDINLPNKSGVELLKELDKDLQVPTILITSLNINDSNKVFEALEAGAVDYIQKPEMGDIRAQSQIIRDKVKGLAKANLGISGGEPRTQDKATGEMSPKVPIFIGSSTGGTVALETLLKRLPDAISPILIVQHIPAFFSKAFAERLNAILPFDVKEAEEGDILKPNQVLIAPGGQQVKLVRDETSYAIKITDDPPVNRFKPSVDYLFESVVRIYKGPKVGLILTGMGKDGAKGLLELKKSGAFTIAQDKKSSVVFGMPRVAIEIGAVDKVCNLAEIPQQLVSLTSKLERKRRAS